MKVNCENVVRCANTECIHNLNGYSCRHIIVAIGSDGRCALCKSKDRPKPKPKHEDTTVNFDKDYGYNPVEGVPVPLTKLIPPLD